MTIRAWRICKSAYAASAFDGEGAARFPGRWNRGGQRVVYAADSQALALLEIVVHASLALGRSYVLVPCDFDESLVEELDIGALPANWRRLVDPSWAPLQAIGGAWLASGRSAVLRVPTVLVPDERNYLLNPAHRDFKKAKIGKPLPFEADARLGRSAAGRAAR